MKPKEVLQQRWDHLNHVTSDEELLSLEYKICKEDPVYFINKWCWTFDPRLSSQGSDGFIPFVLFDYQVDYIKWLKALWEDQKMGTVEKSRDMGYTWLCVVFAVWLWIFHDGQVLKFGSRKLELVTSNDDPDCIFEKINQVIDSLPDFFLPKGYDKRFHSKTKVILNPENLSVILAEGGDNIGRGGRATMYFVDEAGFLERAKKADAALSQNTPCQVWGSTPNGIDTVYYRKVVNDAYRHFRMHWTMDPRKDDAWYAEQCELFDDIIIKREIDIDHHGSVEDLAIPHAWVEAAVGFEIPGDQAKPFTAGMDPAKGGKDYSLFVGGRGHTVSVIERANHGNMHMVTAWCDALMFKHGGSKLFYDIVGIGAGVESSMGSEDRRYEHHGVNTGEKASTLLYPDDREGHERYTNLKTELWMIARQLFKNTYDLSQDPTLQFSPEQLVSIPNDPTLRTQLCMPLVFISEKGKVMLETKKQMAKRLDSYKSPDYADAFVLRLAEPIYSSGFNIGRA